MPTANRRAFGLRAREWKSGTTLPSPFTPPNNDNFAIQNLPKSPILTKIDTRHCERVEFLLHPSVPNKHVSLDKLRLFDRMEEHKQKCYSVRKHEHSYTPRSDLLYWRH